MENNNTQVMDQTTQAVDAIQVPTVDIDVTANSTDVIPLNYQTALANYSEAERQEIMQLAEAIDVTQDENIMSYGSTAFKRTFEQCENFLKSEKGSAADKEVIAQVIELSKKASDSYEDFNLIFQEPGLFQKMFLMLTSAGKDKGKSQTEKLQKSAVTCYKLVGELQKSYENWLETLRKAMGDITSASLSDMDAVTLLEKYIIAGRLADNRIVKQVEDAQKNYEETGLQKYSYEYKKLKEGYETFQVVLVNLEKSRIAYYLSIAQLDLNRKSNKDVQTAIYTQKANNVALIEQQLRNAILNAKTREVLDAQKSINRLNDELIQEISTSIGITAENAKALIYNSFYNIEATKVAFSAIIKSCNAISDMHSQKMPMMEEELNQLKELVKELEPCVNNQRELQTSENNQSLSSTGGRGSNELKF